MTLRRFLSLLVFLALRPACGAERIDWFVQDAPPIFIVSGPHAGQGGGDRWIGEFSARLPHYEHHVVESSFARAWHDIAKRDGICMVGVLRTPEREAVARFSAPLFLADRVRMVVLRARLADFTALTDADGRIDLGKLRERPDLAAGVAARRGLPQDIESRILDPRSGRRIETVPGQTALFGLLAARRIDFLFASTIEADYFSAESGAADQIVTFEVGGLNQPRPVYAACSDLPTGRDVIARIDLLLQDPAFVEHLAAVARHWWPAGRQP